MHITTLIPSETARLVPLLQDLHAFHVAHQPARYTPHPDPEALAEWLENWLQNNSAVQALAAMSPQGAVMGYAIWELEDRAALPVRPAEKRAILHHIAVAQPFRRIGIAKALMTEMQTRARSSGADVIGATYAPFNAASAALMQGFGLTPALTYAEWRQPL